MPRFNKSAAEAREELAATLFVDNIKGCGDGKSYYIKAAQLSLKIADRFMEVVRNERQTPIGEITGDGGYDV